MGRLLELVSREAVGATRVTVGPKPGCEGAHGFWLRRSFKLGMRLYSMRNLRSFGKASRKEREAKRRLKSVSMVTVTVSISDAETAIPFLDVAARYPADRRVVVVTQHPERPLHQVPVVRRKCSPGSHGDLESVPLLGKACGRGEYVGDNVWGKGWEMKSTYCPHCRWAMGDVWMINHVVIVRGDGWWNDAMQRSCEFAACEVNGTNHGLTYEFADRIG